MTVNTAPGERAAFPTNKISSYKTKRRNLTRVFCSCILFLHISSDSCSDAVSLWTSGDTYEGFFFFNALKSFALTAPVVMCRLSSQEIIHDTLIRVFLFLVVIPVMFSCSVSRRTQSGGIWTFVVFEPLIIKTTSASNFLFQVIYYKVGRWYETHKQEGLFPVEGDGRSRRRFKTVFSTARNMMIVIFFCWTPGILSLSLSLSFSLSLTHSPPCTSIFVRTFIDIRHYPAPYLTHPN